MLRLCPLKLQTRNIIGKNTTKKIKLRYVSHIYNLLPNKHVNGATMEALRSANSMSILHAQGCTINFCIFGNFFLMGESAIDCLLQWK